MAKYVFFENKQAIAYTNNEIEDFGAGEVKGYPVENFDKEKLALKYDVTISSKGAISYSEGVAYAENQEVILSNKKNELIGKYKNLQKEIADIKAEVTDLDDTYTNKDANGQALSDARKGVLTTRLDEKRAESDALALECVQIFGEAVISEF